MVWHDSDTAIRNVGQMSLNSEQLVATYALQIQALVGCKESTVLMLNSKTGKARRIFSSVPDVFPLFGTKQIPAGQWTNLVVIQRIPAIFIGAEQIQSTFADHVQILAHGIRSVLNVPIISEGLCVGSINCLFQEESFSSNYEKLSESVSSFVVTSRLADALKPTS